MAEDVTGVRHSGPAATRRALLGLAAVLAVAAPTAAAAPVAVPATGGQLAARRWRWPPATA
ncbi:hypothetical protein JNW91_12175 [Micromonospora sp. STR1_7]|uniref:Uncharacterized protein n=1 Tax=Micromonospora parastrephiae TaxID=2806101 RepID=A0ABS1XTG0_9ACTN|nr:hypothetical protein [Micromonospora parastrephiae]MBM0232551.1 hypothetical protein [Micromonospora parastrephiae]